MKKITAILSLFYCVLFANVLFAGENKGVSLSEVVNVTADVVAIDLGSRTLTLKNENDIIVDLHVSMKVRNFDQLKVGDRISARYYESLTVYLGEHGAVPTEDGAIVIARTQKGDLPGGAVIGTIDVSAKVVGIDKWQRILSMELPKSNVISTRVSEDVDKLNDLKIGDLIHARLTKALAISVVHHE